MKREEFDAVKEMASNARLENESLKAEIESLKKRIGALEKKPKTTSRSATSKKSN